MLQINKLSLYKLEILLNRSIPKTIYTNMLFSKVAVFLPVHVTPINKKCFETVEMKRVYPKWMIIKPFAYDMKGSNYRLCCFTLYSFLMWPFLTCKRLYWHFKGNNFIHILLFSFLFQ